LGLRGLLTQTLSAESTPARQVIQGRWEFNRAFAQKCAEGLPEQLLVYASNAHVYFDPELPNPFAPSKRAPSAPDAARAALASGAAAGESSRVLSIQTYSTKVFVDRVDILLAQGITVGMADGALTREDAIAAINLCVGRVSEIREACKALGSWSAVQAPGVLLVVVENNETRDGVTALTALGHILTLSQVSELLDQGWIPRLSTASYPLGAKYGRDASFGFHMMPPKDVQSAPIEIVVGRDGPGYTVEELE
ncbi:MAG: hypothetical protein H7210_13205, partial [Pyrinomonadaceae bacterium]|nr:hypothetical protein [Phycisphaerales bacterium]